MQKKTWKIIAPIQGWKGENIDEHYFFVQEEKKFYIEKFKKIKASDYIFPLILKNSENEMEIINFCQKKWKNTRIGMLRDEPFSFAFARAGIEVCVSPIFSGLLLAEKNGNAIQIHDQDGILCARGNIFVAEEYFWNRLKSFDNPEYLGFHKKWGQKSGANIGEIFIFSNFLARKNFSSFTTKFQKKLKMGNIGGEIK
ncbi:hypothetical protein [Aminobacterium mobile]|uniref:hypothetical protein n=1 Tax=Aminobacterium mobile TaxID=81467 RepID=UPI0004672F2B|nr:hypothetical protein [Aminobacterium mobile]